MKNSKTVHATHANNSEAAWMTRAFEQDVIVAREKYTQQLHRNITRGSDDTNLHVLVDQEMALLDRQEAETHLATHIQELRRAATAAQMFGDVEQADAIRAEEKRAARLLVSRHEETAEEAIERLRVVQQAVTGGQRAREDSTDVLRRLREGRYVNE